MAYTIDEVRYGIRRSGLHGYHPWNGESSNESIHRGAIDAYAIALKLPEMAGNELAIRKLLVPHIVGLMQVTPMSERRRVLAEVSEQCGIDYLDGTEADGKPFLEEREEFGRWSLGPYRG